MEDMVSVRSEGATIVDAMDMVRDCTGMLPWLVCLVLIGGAPLIDGGPEFGAIDDWSGSPDSRLRLGIILPLIVCVCSGSLV